VKKYLLRGGVLLGISAILSKCLGLYRDRLFIDIFGSGELIDVIFAGFRVPDFFFFLLVTGVVSQLFLPRISHLDSDDQTQFFSSFLWLIVFGFGVICGVGALWPELLVPFFAKGLDPTSQTQVAELARLLFGSVFLLSVSAVFAAFLQTREYFLSLSLAPILYTGGICASLLFFTDRFGIQSVGYAALIGAGLHLLINVVAFFFHDGKIQYHWQKPVSAWKGFKSDFSLRILNNAAYQVNQSADVLIASFLLTGSVGAFSIATNLGGLLMSVVGISAANSAFPRLARAKGDPQVQREILKSSVGWILFFTVPAAVIGALFPTQILSLLYNLSGESLRMASIVFFWTVITLPFFCIIPVFSRAFYANGDVKTPAWITTISLTIATALAAILSLVILPPNIAILGLALGTFTANVLSVVLYGGIFFWRYRSHA